MPSTYVTIGAANRHGSTAENLPHPRGGCRRGVPRGEDDPLAHPLASHHHEHLVGRRGCTLRRRPNRVRRRLAPAAARPTNRRGEERLGGGDGGRWQVDGGVAPGTAAGTGRDDRGGEGHGDVVVVQHDHIRRAGHAWMIMDDNCTLMYQRSLQMHRDFFIIAIYLRGSYHIQVASRCRFFNF